MNINCVICSDQFIPQAEVYVTPCGHIFHYICLLSWFKRSETCPQCRNKTTTTSIHRIYFNLANSEGVTEDASALQFKVDNLEYSIKIKDKEIENYKEKYKKTKAQTAGLRAEVARLEDTERVNNSTMLVLKDQINFFKKKSKEVDKLNEESFQLKQKIKDMENVEIALKGSRQDMENILKNENNVESLALLASTLKRSLVDSDSKRRTLQSRLKLVQTAHSRCDKTISELKCECEAFKKQLQTSSVNHEKEVRFLKEKYELLHKKLSSSEQLSQSVNNSIQRIILESPVNYNTPVLKARSKNIPEGSLVPIANSTVMASKPKNKLVVAGPQLSHLMRKSDQSNDIIHSTQTKTTSSRLLAQPNKHSSIFKSQEPFKQQPRMKPSEVVYDGLGGSSKEDVFPQPNRAASNALKRPKTGAINTENQRLSSRDKKARLLIRLRKLEKTLQNLKRNDRKYKLYQRSADRKREKKLKLLARKVVDQNRRDRKKEYKRSRHETPSFSSSSNSSD